MQKLYCYVDETGQDSKGEVYFVALVIIGRDHEAIRQKLRAIEVRSGKHYRKWTKATRAQRQAYLTAVAQLVDFKHAFFFKRFTDTTDYLSCTIQTVAAGLRAKTKAEYKASVFIDALNKHQRRAVGVQLRRLQVPLEKVRGLEEQRDEFIRLADCISGMVRAAHDGTAYAVKLYDLTKQKGLISEV